MLEVKKATPHKFVLSKVAGNARVTAQPVVLTKTQRMLHKNLNYLVGVFKAAFNMQK